MLAYHNNPALKETIINRLQLHSEHDGIVQGMYCEEGKQRSLSCIMQRVNCGDIHIEMPEEIGIIPPILPLIYKIFEELDYKIAKEFPLKIMQAIPVGRDLSNIWPQFVIWLLIDKKYGVIKHARTFAAKEAIDNVAVLYERKLKNEIIKTEDWLEAKNAAYVTADASGCPDAAAYAAAYVADAAYGAYYADEAAIYAVAYAGDAAKYSENARRKQYKIMSEKLIELVS